MLDSFFGVDDHALLTSAARQLRQRYDVEREALRAAEEVARRRRAAGDVAAAERAEALADELRGATPVLAVADLFDQEARALKQPARAPRKGPA